MEFYMLNALMYTCIAINLLGIVLTFIPDFPAPGGKLWNVAIHIIGAACGYFVLT